MRAVGVERDDAVEAVALEMFERLAQRIRKALSALFDDVEVGPEPGAKLRCIARGTHQRDVHAGHCPRHRDRVFNETAIQIERIHRRAVAADESRLRMAGARRLCHDDQHRTTIRSGSARGQLSHVSRANR